MLHRDEVFDYIEEQVRYDALRDEGMSPAESTLRVLSELDPAYAQWRLRTSFYYLYVKFLSDLLEMDYARKHKVKK